MVVIADDLTGAADCAASCAARGYSAIVLLHSSKYEKTVTAWPDADVLSIDSNTRCLPAEQGSRLVTQLVRLSNSHRSAVNGFVLFKKVDSTLRGNLAGELAALLRARRSHNTVSGRLSILFAPALPAQGRTTVGGRLFVNGVPLEETDIWRTETHAAPSDIPGLLAKADLSCGLVNLDSVRSGPSRLRQAISNLARQNDVVVCDAERDDDLLAIAEASLGNPTLTALAGSAGMASQIPQAIGTIPSKEPSEWNFTPRPTLFLVGSVASVTRQQTRALEAIPEIASFHASPAVLNNSPAVHTRIIQRLQSGCDVLLVFEGGEQAESPSRGLGVLFAECAQLLGGLVATGGETARGALDALGMHRLRVLGEVEPGLPFAVADDWVRPLPVITKAGAFGSSQALVSCREFLRQLGRVPCRANAEDSLLNHKS